MGHYGIRLIPSLPITEQMLNHFLWCEMFIGPGLFYINNNEHGQVPVVVSVIIDGLTVTELLTFKEIFIIPCLHVAYARIH